MTALRIISTTMLLWAMLHATAFAGPEHAVAADPQGRTFVISIGINQYPRGGVLPTIRYGEADAKAIVDEFTSPRQGVPSTNLFTLFGREATLDHIQAAMVKIARAARPEDTLVFYFGGMGVCNDTGDNYIFAASDTVVSKSGEVQRPLRSTLLASLLLQIPTRKQVVILDTCDSRRAVDAIKTALQPRDASDLQALDRQIAVFAVQGPSLEIDALGHGILTAAFLDGISGGAAGNKGQGFVPEIQLENYLNWKVAQIAFEYSGRSHETLYCFSNLRARSWAMSARPTAKFEGNLENGTYDADWSPCERPTTSSEADEPTRGASRKSVSAAALDLGTDFALIVGTDHYSGGYRTLSNPVYDAKSLAAELIRDYGFQPGNMITLYDATNVDVYRAIKQMREMIRSSRSPKDRLLVYVAGHGFTDIDTDEQTALENDHAEGYLILKDSLPRASDEAHTSLMSFGHLKAELESIKAPHLQLIMDVCYGGAFQGTTVMKGILDDRVKKPATREVLAANILKVPASMYLTSGDENHEVSDGRPGQHSPFSAALLEKLQQCGGEDHLVNAKMLYLGLGRLPMKPRIGFFDPPDDPAADFVLIPTTPSAQP